VTLRLLHTLALFWLAGGLGAVAVPVWRAWRTADLPERTLLLSEAQRNETAWLLPGFIAVGVSGIAWAAGADWNLVTTGWLLALEIVYMLDVFVALPLLGVGLRRVRYLALQANKRGEITPELAAALADNVPVVFATILVATLPLMAWLAVFKPF
jgi:uncharacterized membrane protein